MRAAVMTRDDLSTAIKHVLGLSQADSRSLVEDILRHLCAGLSTDGKVKIPAFGTFTVRDKPARMARNPRTQEPALIPRHRVLTFKASKHFRSRVAELRAY